MEGYKRVCDVADLPQGSNMLVSDIDRVDICLINKEGRYYAITNICPHKGGLINEGKTDGKFITCPLHFAKFNLETGRNSWPAPRPLRVYDVKIAEGSIYIKLPADEKVSGIRSELVRA